MLDNDAAHECKALRHYRVAREREALADCDEIEDPIRPPPWRDRLHDLRNDRGQFAAVISDKDARAALHWGLIETDQASRAGRRWLHHLRDHPVALRRTIDHALKSVVLRLEVGQPKRFDRVLLIEGVRHAFKHLTGEELGRSVTSDTQSREGGLATGPRLRLAWICLKPFEPDISPDAVARAIRNTQTWRRAKRLRSQRKRLL